VHGRGSEFFRVKHGDHEVADEQDGDGADDDGFHGCLMLERFAVAGVKRSENEEAEGHGDEDEVDHGGAGWWKHPATVLGTGQ
jgi:hypothetical protein